MASDVAGGYTRWKIKYISTSFSELFISVLTIIWSDCCKHTHENFLKASMLIYLLFISTEISFNLFTYLSIYLSIYLSTDLSI